MFGRISIWGGVELGVYIRSVEKDNDFIDTPPLEEKNRMAWLRYDARLWLQIYNPNDKSTNGMINHCEFVKELVEYLECLYSLKDNISWICEVCKAFNKAKKESQSLTTSCKKTCENLNMLMPLNEYTKTQQQSWDVSVSNSL